MRPGCARQCEWATCPHLPQVSFKEAKPRRSRRPMHNNLWQWNFLTGHDVLLVLACYAIGCCTAGYYWVRWRTGLDLRFQGSGNVGARNVGRIAGPSGFAVTLLIDGFKGAMAMR